MFRHGIIYVKSIPTYHNYWTVECHRIFISNLNSVTIKTNLTVCIDIKRAK